MCDLLFITLLHAAQRPCLRLQRCRSSGRWGRRRVWVILYLLSCYMQPTWVMVAALLEAVAVYMTVSLALDRPSGS